ncbi:hypothetical protein BABINDRAFT_154883 [Babjeviella inositovora NRRL Y-12698]|uniref:Uncharacterized protein n=1 Tax=Babjeviella inositovora NRRL Y-12698 TaxID=984486 RepID=A0A1E3QMP6_9ASCO|nr:uncharacterized protein BABINDRAFT_154883 [Babjeviella inositovora NRRL Y-12698]ODQ78908.1 hypothetical protein BABINDRAFT_154883 [Babjeviella inositovora NRRL Y-12698]
MSEVTQDFIDSPDVYPLPLIRRRASSLSKPDPSMPIHSRVPFYDLFADENLQKLRNRGILILAVTWIGVLVGMMSVFNIHRYLVPSAVYATWQLFVGEENDFPMDGYYICALILISAVFWVWASVQWLGMTLFVFTKGRGLNKK